MSSCASRLPHWKFISFCMIFKNYFLFSTRALLVTWFILMLFILCNVIALALTSRKAVSSMNCLFQSTAEVQECIFYSSNRFLLIIIYYFFPAFQKDRLPKSSLAFLNMKKNAPGSRSSWCCVQFKQKAKKYFFPGSSSMPLK